MMISLVITKIKILILPTKRETMMEDFKFFFFSLVNAPNNNRADKAANKNNSGKIPINQRSNVEIQIFIFFL